MADAIGNVSIPKTEGVEASIATFAQNISSMPKIQYDAIGNALVEIAKHSKEIAESAKLLSDKLAEKSSESAEKSAEKSADSITDELSKRQKQIYEYWSSL